MTLLPCKHACQTMTMILPASYACPKASRKTQQAAVTVSLSLSLSLLARPQTKEGFFPAANQLGCPAQSCIQQKIPSLHSLVLACSSVCAYVCISYARVQGCESTSCHYLFFFGTERFMKHILVSNYQSSSSSFSRCMAFLRARRASARLPPKLGVGVLLRLPVLPFSVLRLMPESRCCSSAGLRLAAGRFAGGCGGVGLARGGAGGARGAGACSWT